jgi:hypothetical protein
LNQASSLPAICRHGPAHGLIQLMNLRLMQSLTTAQNAGNTRQHSHAFGGGKALEQFSRNRHSWIIASFETTNNDD